MLSRIASLSKSNILLYSLTSIVVLAVLATTVGYAKLSNEVTLSLDGETTTVRSMSGTVGEILDDEGISVGEHDIVAPDLDEAVTDGSRITVRFGRPLELNVDGTANTYWVTATNVDAALNQLGKRFLGADLSVSRGAGIDREGMTLVVSTPKNLIVKIGKQDAVKRRVAGLTVADVLENLKVKYDRDDIVVPAPGSHVKAGDKIQLIRVKTVTKSVEGEAVDFGTAERSDSSMYTGESDTVRSGIDGLRDVVYRLTYRNGQLFATKVVSQNVLKEAVDAIVKVGTKQRPVDAVWDRLAECESGGNWSINTGNGYYGGLQFNLGTWQSYGGSGLPSDNSREEQIRIATKLRDAAGGYGAWPHCSSKLGLPR